MRPADAPGGATTELSLISRCAMLIDDAQSDGLCHRSHMIRGASFQFCPGPLGTQCSQATSSSKPKCYLHTSIQRRTHPSCKVIGTGAPTASKVLAKSHFSMPSSARRCTKACLDSLSSNLRPLWAAMLMKLVHHAGCKAGAKFPAEPCHSVRPLKTESVPAGTWPKPLSVAACTRYAPKVRCSSGCSRTMRCSKPPSGAITPPSHRTPAPAHLRHPRSSPSDASPCRRRHADARKHARTHSAPTSGPCGGRPRQSPC